jgi:hypothetical protein
MQLTRGSVRSQGAERSEPFVFSYRLPLALRIAYYAPSRFGGASTTKRNLMSKVRLTLLHLSDIHLRGGTNPISSRVKALAAAVFSQAPNPDAILILVSGDIAFSGKHEEYEQAKALFSELDRIIREQSKDIELAFASVPGNHDCYLPEQAINLRKALVVGIGPSIETTDPDPEILNQLLSAQVAYFEFQSQITSRAVSAEQRLCSGELLVIKGVRIQTNLYNTALLSQRAESQSLRVPVAVFDLKIHPFEDIVLSIAVLHHTVLWFESENGIRFRRHIEENADIVLSGHQHFDHTFEKTNLEGAARALYLEGSALQDMANPAVSGFNLVDIDLNGRKQKIVHFDWKNDHYSATIRSDWSPLIENRAFRHDFRASEEFNRFLDDPGAGYSHNRKRQLTLRDLFVYPDLTVRKSLNKPEAVDVPAEQFHDLLRTADHVIFEGAGQSGRTALAKITFSDLLNMLGCVPIFVDGRDLRSISEDALKNRISSAVREQYAPELVERFLHLERRRRVLIIDDWHRASLSSQGRADLLKIANSLFGKVFLFSDPMFDIQEFVTRAKDQTAILQFQHATIQQFGYKTRGRLIEKWLTLGREHSFDVEELTREIDEIENIVTTLMGKNTLPKFPFIVLSVLQAYQEKKTTSAEAGSYGYVYEVLITTALASTARSPSDIDKKYTFLSHLAYRMFKSEVDGLTYAEIVKVSEEYFHAYGLPVAPDPILNDLIGARVLAMQGGSYRFYYSYYFEYFVARYYKDALQNRTDQSRALGEELIEMADYVIWERYSKILMFFLYFTKNTTLIDRLMEKANEAFNEYEPASLDEDVSFTKVLFRESSAAVELPAGPVSEHREARNVARDQREKTLPVPEGKRITYSQTLNVADKLHIAAKYLELLGQILRNFPGSLRAEAKLKIAKCTYLLGLRVLAAILDLLSTGVEHYRDLIANALKENLGEKERSSLKKLEDLADQLFFLLARLSVAGSIKRVSVSVGSPELEQTYMDVLENLPSTNAVQLVDLSIRLDHFRGVPEERITDLHDLLETNTFAHQILIDLVVEHLTFFEEDYKVRQRMGSLLGFKASHPRILRHRTKLLKTSADKKGDRGPK